LNFTHYAESSFITPSAAATLKLFKPAALKSKLDMGEQRYKFTEVLVNRGVVYGEEATSARSFNSFDFAARVGQTARSEAVLAVVWLVAQTGQQVRGFISELGTAVVLKRISCRFSAFLYRSLNEQTALL